MNTWIQQVLVAWFVICSATPWARVFGADRVADLSNGAEDLVTVTPLLPAGAATPPLYMLEPADDGLCQQEISLIFVTPAAAENDIFEVVAKHGLMSAPRQLNPFVWQSTYHAHGSDPEETLVAEFITPKDHVRREFTLKRPCYTPESLRIFASDHRVLLGDNSTVLVKLEGRHPNGEPIRPNDAVLSSNSGELGAIREIGDGILEATWTADKRSSPHLAIIAAHLRAAPTETLVYSVIQLVGQPKIPVATEPGAQVWAHIGTSVFGPARANAQGQALLQVEVPPGSRSMVIRVKDTAGNTSRSTQDLSIPRYSHILLVPPDPEMTLQVNQLVKLMVIVVTDYGLPAELTRAESDSGRSTIEQTLPLRSGIVGITVRATTTPGRDVLAFRIHRDDGEQEAASATLTIASEQELMVSAHVLPTLLTTDGAPGEVLVTVTDPAGLPVSDVLVTGSTLLGHLDAFRTTGAGQFAATLRAPVALDPSALDAEGKVQVQIHVAIRRPPSVKPPSQLLLYPESFIVVGKSPRAVLTLVVLDAESHPSVEYPLAVTYLDGDAERVQRVVTDSGGRAVVELHPATTGESLQIWVRGETPPHVSGSVRLLVLAPREEFASFPGLEPTATSPHGPEIVTQTTFMSGQSRSIRITASPNILRYPETRESTIRFVLRDYRGNIVRAPGSRVMATQGQTTTPRLTSDGTYEATYLAESPTVAAERVEISVVNAEGTLIGETEIELIRDTKNWNLGIAMGVLTSLEQDLVAITSVRALRRLTPGVASLFGGLTAKYAYFRYSTTDGRETVSLHVLPMEGTLQLRYTPRRVKPYLEVMGSAAFIQAQQNLMKEAPESGWSVFPGVEGALGMEIGIGPGGLMMDVGTLMLKTRPILEQSVVVDALRSNVIAKIGYCARF